MARKRRTRDRHWRLLLLAAVAPLAACQLLVGLSGDLEAPPGAADDAKVAEAAVEAGADAPDAPDAPDARTRSAYEEAILADQPVAYYRLDEPAGAACADRSGNGNGANLGGAFVRGRPALVAGGASVHLDEQATLVLDPKLDFGFTTDYTFELWFRTEAGDAGGALLSNLEGILAGDHTGSILYFEPNDLGFERWARDLIRYSHATQPVVPGPGNIIFVAVVTRDGTPRLFVNGVPNFGMGGMPDAAVVARSLVLGGRPGDYGDVAFYAKALPDVRIVAHYAAGRMN